MLTYSTHGPTGQLGVVGQRRGSKSAGPSSQNTRGWVAYTTEFIFLQFWKLGSPSQSANQSGFWWGLSFWFAHGQLLPVSLHGGERELTGVFSCKDTNPTGSGLHPDDLILP